MRICPRQMTYLCRCLRAPGMFFAKVFKSSTNTRCESETLLSFESPTLYPSEFLFRRKESGFVHISNRSRDKLSPCKHPVRYVICSVVWVLPSVWRDTSVVQNCFRVDMLLIICCGTFASSSAFVIQECGTESKAFL